MVRPIDNDPLITIRFGGILGKTFGKVHKRCVLTTREAIKALCVTLPGFEQFLNSSKQRGLTYAVFRGKRNLSEDDLELSQGTEEIRIMPVVIGSKRSGVLQTIFGAVLVAVGAIGAFTPWGQALGGATWGSYAMQAGGAMMAGGVIQMLSPQPGGLAMKDQGENKPSYAFGSPTNTVSQGYPVPIGYGKRRIGGAIISAGIYVEDQQ
ncbi:tail assembly protein [Xenorhabdus griffiniae]|uniref:tail assembly protein n=1 Tax=Xenorhabdus griffiniae TaxID=351672 RepID=UPI0030D1144E